MIKLRNLIALISLLLMTPALASTINFVKVVEGFDNAIYVATHTGLKRFDGMTYHEINALPSRRVYDVVVNQNDKRLYASVEGHGVFEWNGESNQAHLITNTVPRKLTAANSVVYFANYEGVSFKSSRNGVSGSVLVGKKVIRLFSHDDVAYVLTEDGLWQLMGDKATHLYDVALNNAKVAAIGDKIFFNNGNELLCYSILEGNVSTLQLSGKPNALSIYKQGYVAAAIEDKVYLHSLFGKAKQGFMLTTQADYIKDLLVDSASNIWLVSNTGLKVLDINSTEIKMPVQSQYNVVSNSAQSFLVGTGQGVFMHQHTRLEWDQRNTELKELAALDVTDLHQHNTLLAVATSNGLVLPVSVPGERDFNMQLVNSDYVLNVNVVNDEWVIGTSANGIKSYNLDGVETNTFEHIDLPSKEVLSTKLFDNKLFIATGNGLAIYNMINGGVRHELVHITGKISNVQDFNAKVYTGTYGDGLFVNEKGEWRTVNGPKFITDLIKFNDHLVAATPQGLYQLVGDSLALIPNTEQRYFGSNSLVVGLEGLYAVNDKALMRFKNLNFEALAPLNLNRIAVNGSANTLDKLSTKDYITLHFSNNDYINQPFYKTEFKHNDSNWLPLKNGELMLSQLSQGQHTIVVRTKLNQEEYQQSEPIVFYVSGPFYTSVWFLVCVIIAAIVIVCAVSFVLLRRNQQMRNVYRTARSNNQKLAISEALQKLMKGSELCQGTPLQLSDGLVLLDEARINLFDIVQAYGALGIGNLKQGIEMLHISTKTQYPNRDIEFNLSLGDKPLGSKVEQDVFAFINHALSNALKHSNASYIEVSGKRNLDTVSVFVQDNGRGITFIDKFFKFGTGIESMRDIATSLNGRVEFKRSKFNSKGSIISLSFDLPQLDSAPDDLISHYKIESNKLK